jgi:hypothetical protein
VIFRIYDHLPPSRRISLLPPPAPHLAVIRRKILGMFDREDEVESLLRRGVLVALPTQARGEAAIVL